MIPMLPGNIFDNCIICIIHEAYGSWEFMEPICFKSVHWHVTLMTVSNISKSAWWWNRENSWIIMTSQTNLFWG